MDESARSGEDTSETEQGVINGNSYSVTDRLIKITYNGYLCTGTLITPTYVLTAAHCASATPSSYMLQVGNNGATSGVDRIKIHPSVDAALLHLTTPLAAPGFKSSLYTYSASSLRSKSIELQGFGASSCTGDGVGTMRYADLVGGTYGNGINTTYLGSNGQGTGPGDSGGPFWYFFNGVPFQTGVVKSGNCAGESYGPIPELLEGWVFAEIYNSPVPIPTTTACKDHVCSGSGYSDWVLLTSNGAVDFWNRPLATYTSRSTPSFTPCPGSNNYYLFRANWSLNGSDTIRINTGYSSPTLSGSNEVAWWGLGSMSIDYSTGGTGGSQGLNWLDVQCDYQAKAEDLVCHGARCATTVDPVPPSWNKTVSWTPCGGEPFYFFLNGRTTAPDAISVNSTTYSGNIDARWQWSGGGTATVRVATGAANNYSPGIRSLYAVCSGW